MIRIALCVALVACSSSSPTSQPEPAKEPGKGSARSATLPIPAPPASQQPVTPKPAVDERPPLAITREQVPEMTKTLVRLDQMIAQATEDAASAGGSGAQRVAAAELETLKAQRAEVQAAIEDAMSGSARVPAP
ncbi:MAG: hypothetical protein IPQ07_32970 [Myxococcales bacterium]|nr:hypothetical protein [Myxococcales bacterium]